MTRCAWCPWHGNPKFLRAHVGQNHPDISFMVHDGLRAIDEDIEAALEQVGFLQDFGIMDNWNEDDEDSDARFNP